MRIWGLAVCACFAVGGEARAGAVQLLCLLQGATAFTERDPVTSVWIAISDRKWTVVHRGLGGTEYDRGAQYAIKDMSIPARHQIAWEGRDRKDRKLSMVGTITATDDGLWLYEESIYERKARTYFMRAVCSSALNAWGLPGSDRVAQSRAAPKPRM